MPNTVKLFIQSLFLEGLDSDFSISQDYIIEDGMTVMDLFNQISQTSEMLAFRLIDEQGNLRPNVNIFVGSQNIKSNKGLDTKISANDEISIFPALSGG